MFYNLPLSYIHLELTTKCNAACPMCMRNLQGVEHPLLVKTDFDITWLDNLDLPANKLTLCGNYGDPVIHPKLPLIIEYWINKYNNPITLMTNGGMKTPKYWKNLAEISKNKLKIVFGIDGLEDTNHLYRKNVKWNKLIENAKAFINAGGNATWKFIIFKHNQHQVDDACNYAKSLGFKQFEKIITDRFISNNNERYFSVVNKNNNELYRLYPADYDQTNFKSKNLNRIEISKKWDGEINCYAKNENSVYIAADGRVYPCCNTGHHYNLNRPSDKEINELQNTLMIPNIKNIKLSECVMSQFFYKIQEKWNTTNPLMKCKFTCGIKRDNLNKIQTF